ncbi:RDD family protein [Haloferula sp.]|uniref:RDD family protein n=1 Tax=Haloferula sp. TaxID=2497595 RepID=UPI003C74B62F
MGDEEKKNPPPPSLSKPAATPPPPSLHKPDPAPSMPPAAGNSGPPVLQEKPIVKDEDQGDDELVHGAMAPLNTRLIAALIDGLVAMGLYLIAWKLLPAFLENLAWVFQFGYWVTRDSLPFLKGQSIGKTAMKLKVEKRDGTTMIKDWPTAVIRNLPMIIPFFGPLIEAIVLFTRDNKPEKGLRLGDDFAKTKVVVWRPEEEAAE